MYRPLPLSLSTHDADIHGTNEFHYQNVILQNHFFRSVHILHESGNILILMFNGYALSCCWAAGKGFYF
ncbi:hypothetical protein DAI22_01g148700 [Oryza sativa Japonica Group]|nr:hypothetical protein DAI22_01g148700 [Oryza sativa Japonica Group]